jgi:hypothetical protein
MSDAVDPMFARVIAAIDREDVSTSLTVLTMALAYVWGQSPCPDCRRHMARQLRKNVPTMLRLADEAAAQLGSPTPPHVH